MGKEESTNLFEEVDFSSITNEIERMTSGAEEAAEETTKEQDAVNQIEETEETKQKETSTEDTEETEEGSQEEQHSKSTEDTASSEDTNDENSSPLTPYAKLLVDEGVLPNLNLEEFKGTAEELTAAFNNRVDAGIDDYKSQIPQEIKTLLDNYEEGVPLSALLEIDSKRAEYKAIPEDKVGSDKDLQKSLLREYYKQSTRFDDAKINKLIQRSEDLDDLGEEAKVAHQELIKLQDVFEQQEVERAKEESVAFEQRQKESLQAVKGALDKSDEVIPGIKVNKNFKDDLYKAMTTPVAYDQNGTPVNQVGKYRLEHPYEFDIMINYLYKATKEFKDWSVLNTAGKNSAIKEFEIATQKQNKTARGSIPKSSDKNSSNTTSIINEIEKLNF